MENYTYKTKGTCSQRIDFTIDENVIKNVRFYGGCDGNLKAISKLIDGMPVEQVIDKLSGITCGFKKTSCGDQLAQVLTEINEQQQSSGPQQP